MPKFGKWEKLGEPLGRGGQGEVYRARDTEIFDLGMMRRSITQARLQPGSTTQEALDRAADELALGILAYREAELPENLAALKIFHASAHGEEYKQQIERMHREISALKALSHPNIIRILDSDVGQKWIVMQYFDEGTLDQHLEEHKGDFLGALRSFRPLVEAVASMHKAGHIHRDIKPENVFLSSGNLILGDLGLVYFLDDARSRLTNTFENVGSRDWMPPWAQGIRVDEVRPSFDIYSLGKLLWSMVSGQAKVAHYWYRRRKDLRLEEMFPLSTDVRWAEAILDKCIVEEEVDCLPNAMDLLDLVDRILPAVNRHSQVVAADVSRVCRVCGLGRYRSLTRETLTLQQSFTVFVCDHCKHTEFFHGGKA